METIREEIIERGIEGQYYYRVFLLERADGNTVLMKFVFDPVSSKTISKKKVLLEKKK